MTLTHTKRAIKISTLFIALSLAMNIGSAMGQSAAPFKSTATTQQDNDAAVIAINGQKAAGQTLAKSLDGIWDNLITEDGSFFSSLIDGLNPLLAVGFAAWVFYSFPKMMDRTQPFPWALAARPLIVFLLLSNGGVNLIRVSQASKILIYHINDSVLDSSINGVRGREAIQIATLNEAYDRALAEKVAACNSEPEGEPRKKCVDDGREQLLKLARQAGGEPKNFPEKVGAAFVGAFQGFAIGSLATFSALFHGVLAYGFATFVVLSPVTISLALIPMKFNGLQVYAAGIVSVGLMIVFYSGASAVTASLFAVPGNHGLYIIISGLINPFMAMGIGVAGFAGIYLGGGAALKVVGGLTR